MASSSESTPLSVFLELLSTYSPIGIGQDAILGAHDVRLLVLLMFLFLVLMMSRWCCSCPDTGASDVPSLVLMMSRWCCSCPNAGASDVPPLVLVMSLDGADDVLYWCC
jgi:hypothetical protein